MVSKTNVTNLHPRSLVLKNFDGSISTLGDKVASQRVKLIVNSWNNFYKGSRVELGGPSLKRPSCPPFTYKICS